MHYTYLYRDHIAPRTAHVSNQIKICFSIHSHKSTSLLAAQIGRHVHIYIIYIYIKHTPNPSIETNLLELNCPSVAIYI